MYMANLPTSLSMPNVMMATATAPGSGMPFTLSNGT